MIDHPVQFCETICERDIDAILDAALEVLETKGLIIQSKQACRILAEAGAAVQMSDGKVCFPREQVARYLAQVPSQWTLHARNPERNIPIGSRRMSITPGYGSPFIGDAEGIRREATLEDFACFARLAYSSDVIDMTGGLLVEPNDIEPRLRPQEILYALIRNSDKPLMGSSAGPEGAKTSLDMCEIVFGDLRQKPCVMALININSPLRLDAAMAGAMLPYAEAGQPILLTPGIMMGISSPVTMAGAMVQAFAELMGCTVLVQAIRPGCPVIIGLGGVGSDLRHVATGFGRPENAMGIQIGTQIARRLNIPFRCSAAVTGSRIPDCRSGYERMMTALTAYHCGAHLCLQAAGILDSINTMSYEQFIIDLEIWAYIKRLSSPPVITGDTLGLDIIDFHTEHYLSHEHTIRHMRRELYTPRLADADTYEQWSSCGNSDVVAKARYIADETLKNCCPPELDKFVEKELNAYMNSKKKNTACVC